MNVVCRREKEREMNTGMKRMATLVGCNYQNTEHELYGCINDVLAMREVLVHRFGFDPSYIELLTDAPDSLIMPTGANIRTTLSRMVDRAEPGDVLFFHYSGHGTRIPAPRTNHGHKEEEAIVPCDFNLITDVDFRHLVNHLPEGASFTILSDSCHSGGLIDKEKEQIGPTSTNRVGSFHRPKTILFDSILHHLSSLSRIDSPNIGIHLSELFGSDASAKFHQNDNHPGRVQLASPDEGILLSGCQANETSADMNPEGKGGKAFGAFSNAVQMVLKGHEIAPSNRELVTRTREVLHTHGFVQHPCLYCSNKNADAPFLLQSM
ncbi:metacaspase-9-like [Tasmannia lanceolata]|uniref:metacaspase-9-like n=1 Tax=Tasmannia lanceolata TaxID=3420 RepID=UPI004063471E